MNWVTNPEIWVALLTLTALEIVLGIDNIIFISILTGKLPAEQQGRARTLGLTLALIFRVLLLLSIAWIARLTTPLFVVFGRGISGRDLILLGGGLFLLAKSTYEIHDHLEGKAGHVSAGTGASFVAIIGQVIVLDLVFSLDSVITAVGMANNLPVMVAAVIIAIGVMLVASGPISAFVNRHPSVTVLALSFLILIGMSLIAEGLHQHIPKGYIYFAMGFSVFVEAINLRARRSNAAPVQLHQRVAPADGAEPVTPGSHEPAG